MMNKTRIIALIVTLHSIIGYGQTIAIEEAVKQNRIDYTIAGSWDYNDPKEFLDADGQYFGKCMTITIRNKNNDTLSLAIENGLLLMCDDTTVQDMLITKPIYVYLYPRQRKSFQLYAMCSEIHDAMPGRQKKYRVGKKAKKELVRISKVIDDMLMHNVAGQGAVWAYTDNASESDLRKYGATDKTLEITIEILNRANVHTAINPEIIEEPIISDTLSSKNEKHKERKPDNKTGLTIDWFYIYIIAGLIILLLIYGVYTTIRLRNRRNHET